MEEQKISYFAGQSTFVEGKIIDTADSRSLLTHQPHFRLPKSTYLQNALWLKQKNIYYEYSGAALPAYIHYHRHIKNEEEIASNHNVRLSLDDIKAMEYVFEQRSYLPPISELESTRYRLYVDSNYWYYLSQQKHILYKSILGEISANVSNHLRFSLIYSQTEILVDDNLECGRTANDVPLHKVKRMVFCNKHLSCSMGRRPNYILRGYLDSRKQLDDNKYNTFTQQDACVFVVPVYAL